MMAVPAGLVAVGRLMDGHVPVIVGAFRRVAGGALGALSRDVRHPRRVLVADLARPEARAGMDGLYVEAVRPGVVMATRGTSAINACGGGGDMRSLRPAVVTRHTQAIYL